MAPPTPRADYDGAWKEALELHFAAFLVFFFPQAHADIDWTRPVAFLEQELRQAMRRAGRGRHAVDKLAKVWLKSGDEAWVLIHVEVQSQKEEDFAERVFTYNSLLFIRLKRCVVSLAVLGDTQPDWRPSSFGYGLWGCETGTRFPVVKLLDWAGEMEALERDPNPIAVLVAAHLQTQATRRRPASRFEWKLRVTRWLYERGYDLTEFASLFRCIDVMMALPAGLQEEYDHAVERYEEERKVPLLSSIERKAIERGLQKGMEEGVQQGIQQGIQQGVVQRAREAVLELLEFRFGAVPGSLSERVCHLDDAGLLKRLHLDAAAAPSVEDFEKKLPN